MKTKYERFHFEISSTLHALYAVYMTSVSLPLPKSLAEFFLANLILSGKSASCNRGYERALKYNSVITPSDEREDNQP